MTDGTKIDSEEKEEETRTGLDIREVMDIVFRGVPRHTLTTLSYSSRELMGIGM